MTFAAAVIAASVFTRAMERVDSMDPVEAQSVYDSKAVALVYETPLEIDYAARPYRLIPGVCELPDVSADGLEYVFRMVPDAPVRAADVVRAVKRLTDPANPSSGSWTMKNVSSVAGEGDSIVRIVLKKRQHVFPWLIAMPYCSVMREDGSGTGPYTLESWWRNHEMVFAINREWRGWSKPCGVPGEPYSKIRFLTVDDTSTQWLMFLKGELDYLGEIARDNWGAVIDSSGNLDGRLSAAGVRLCGGRPAMEVRYIGFNMNDPVVGGNPALRRALSCAFDSATWKAFYNGSIEPADGPVPPGVEGRLEAPGEYAFDIERSRSLMAEAGYPGGIDPATGRRLKLTLSIGRPTQDSREAGELLASFFAAAGVEIKLDFKTWDAFLSAVNKGHTQMHMLGWVGDYPDPENFLQLFHSSNSSPGPNHSSYSNPAYDREYDLAMECADPAERNAHWAECQRIVRSDRPWIFMHYTKNYSLVRPGVLNYIPGDFPYGHEKYLRTENK